MPSLLDVAPSRPPRVWTIGCAHDAIAMAVAYHHAWGDSATADINVYLSGRPGPVDPVHFALADVRCLPTDRRRQAFQRRDRRYVPRRLLMERVILATPARPVDLVTIRTIERSRPAPAPGASVGQAGSVGPAMDRVRRGGHLLFAEPPPSGVVPEDDFRPLDGAGRLFERMSDPPRWPAPADGRATGEPAPVLAGMAGSGPAGATGDPGGPGGDISAITLADRAERARLVESHYNLARSLARRFAHHGELADDLEQVALLALVKAAGRYSPDHGSSFATFATASILGELKRHFRDRTWMLRVPRSLQETYLSIKTAREELGQTLGASPTVPQIATHLGISDESVLAAMEAGDSYWPASLDTPRRGEDEPGVDVPVIDGGFDSSLERRQLRESLPKLEERERLIIKRLYFDGWTQRRVAEEIGVSQMQVSRLMARILAKLRDSFGEA